MLAAMVRLRGLFTRKSDPNRPESRGTPRTVAAELAQLTAARRHDEAVALARDHLAEGATHEGFLKQVRLSAQKAGAMTLLQEATDLLVEHAGTPSLRGRQRIQLGRLRETSPQWSPTISTPVLPVADPVAGRVLHVLKISMPHRQSGYSVRTMYSLVAELGAGLEPVAVTALDFPASIGVTDCPPEESVQGVRHLRLQRAGVPSDEPFDSYLDAWATELAQCAATERPELIHVHSGHRGYETALVALAVGRALAIPVVYEVRGFFESLWTSDTEWAERSETYDRRYATEARCMAAADAVVTLSESMRGDIIARGIDPATVVVVPNGVDAQAFAPRERRVDLVEQWGLRGRFVFGYVSNLDHFREGHELLIEAAAHLRDAGIAATALIVGDGKRRAELEALAVERGVQDLVVFTGRVSHSEVLDYYALYDVFVVPRVDERAARLVTPLKPFEAMAAGIPVVVSDLPALAEITGHGERGVAFRAGDATDLARVLADLREQPQVLANLRAAARRWVVEERSWASNGERYRALYADVLRRSSTER